MTVTEFRTDPLTGRVAIVVPGRSARPNEHALPPPTMANDPGCPFCEGNEAKTPAELAAFGPPGRAPNSAGWWVRVIPNRFPTVAPESVPAEALAPTSRFSKSPAVGHHEVVIESPNHAPTLAYLPPEQATRVVTMCRDRVRALSEQPRVGSVTLFENTGPESGGSLWHPHAQLVTVPELTPWLVAEIDGSERYLEQWGGSCALEEVAREELEDGTRRVLETGGFVSFAPFASALPYELRLVGRRHASSFADLTDEEAEGLAGHLQSLLRALLAVVPGASYNFVLRSPVKNFPHHEEHHWHLDLYPRLVRPDGFDLASGYSVNTVLPEVAAEALRDALAAKR